ncbi:MAG: xylose isomerase-like barrel protein [Bacilli bacterium]|nr:xylose isomerase-like barrel protein [Bacilli bacterium]
MYSATQWIFGKEDLEVSFARLKRYGYDGVELAGEPYTTDQEKVSLLLTKYGLICTSICGIYAGDRDLSSSNLSIRNKAVQYVKDCIDLAKELNASHVIVVPTTVGKVHPQTSQQEEWMNAVQSVKEAGEYALSKQINLAIEALNRYETYLVHNLQTALKFMKEVNVESVKLMADLFHMNIEERNSSHALKLVAPHLIHVHIADNTREAAGLGQTNFQEIMVTLKDIHYQGPITMEFLPTVSNPYLASKQEDENDVKDFYTEQSIRHIKGLNQIEEKVETKMSHN